MLGKLKDLTVNQDGSQDITLTVEGDFRELYDELFDKEVDVTIKKYSKKRSLDSNAKAWIMIDQLAEKLRITKTEVYRNAIREIGGVSDVVCVRDYAADTLCKNWETKGQGWMAEQSPSKLPGCVNVTLWYGSSVYNTKQMADLINVLIQLCNEQGIPTMTDEEVEKSLLLWQKKVEKNE
ncbi:MAG: hypothetical protein J6Y78_15965 [Paludibacteraceae bacterium]|nr:hypothetical protein [Paludibacteraceae bacterium]